LNLKTGWLFAAVVSVTLARVPASAHAGDWQTNHDAGWKAYQEGRFEEAEKFLTAAEKEARSFGDKDPRLAMVLDHMAWVLCAEGRPQDAEPLARWALTWREKVLGA
jgi:hypothetical protein